MIDIKKLKELVRLMVANDLTEVDLESENEHVKLRRGSAGGPVQYVPAAASAPALPPAAAPAPAAPAAAAPATGSAPAAEGETITSPMVGTFYSSPSPDAKPYLSVGSHVSADSVVCIIEAMKVFNEIKSEISGTVVEVLVKNGQAVEFGQPLFVVKPD